MELDQIAGSVLFRGVPREALPKVLDCLHSRTKSFARGAMICRPGEQVQSAGLLLSGEAHIEHVDPWGHQSILAGIGPGELFAEVYACMPGAVLPVGVTAVRECEVLFLDIGRVFRTEPGLCGAGALLIPNLLQVLAGKNLALTRKIHCTASKSIRSRVLTYLSFQAVEQGATTFEIPFTRQQLADYLCVDRSALSAELSRMQREGLLEYRRNRFALHASQDGIS